jgi:hypothetical protein
MWGAPNTKWEEIPLRGAPHIGLPTPIRSAPDINTWGGRPRPCSSRPPTGCSCAGPSSARAGPRLGQGWRDWPRYDLWGSRHGPRRLPKLMLRLGDPFPFCVELGVWQGSANRVRCKVERPFISGSPWPNDARIPHRHHPKSSVTPDDRLPGCSSRTSR